MSNVNIYSELISVFSENTKEIKSYLDFIEHSKEANRFLSSDFYVEEHHILTRKTFPQYENLKDCPWNSVKLTTYQHLVAHAKLAKLKSYDMRWAYSMMLGRLQMIDRTCPLINFRNADLRKGLNNPKTDKTLYMFQNIHTLEIVGPIIRQDMVRNHIKKNVQIPPEVLDLTLLKSVHGWCLYDENDPDRPIKIRNNQVGDKNPLADKRKYQFQRLKDGFVTESLTRMAFCEKYEVSKRQITDLFAGKMSMTIGGWLLYEVENPNKIEEIKYKKKIARKTAQIKYRFINVDIGFITFPMTRYDLSVLISVPVGGFSVLFKEKPLMVARWSLYDETKPDEWMVKRKTKIKVKPSTQWITTLQQVDYMHPSSS